MKKDKYQRRFYRQWSRAQGLRICRVVSKETDLQILTDKALAIGFLQKKIEKYRRQIQAYIAKDGRFLTSLKPLPIELSAPPIVKAMAKAARLANVGPMAAVAGAIAQFLGRDLLRSGCKEVIIENGGDIFLKLSKPRNVGIYCGKGRLLNQLKLAIKPGDTPLGVCASSGIIGHSLSFGRADSVIILAKDACLADAVATATCNRVQKKEDLPGALNFARAIKGASGVVIIFKNRLITWGKVTLS